MKTTPIILISIAILLVALFATLLQPQKQNVATHYSLGGFSEIKYPIEEQLGSRVVSDVNSKIQRINGFSSEMKVQSSLATLNGTIDFERDKNLRMIQSSFLGKELDIGSNNDIFWFWSRRMRPSKLYFSKHENAFQSGLRTPFDPQWIMEVIGMKDINIKNCTILHKNKMWHIAEKRINTEQKVVVKVTLIDESKMAVVGHYIYDTYGNMLVSAEITEFYQTHPIVVPKQIKTTWFEEDVSNTWELKNPRINVMIDPRIWVIPKMKNVEELGVSTCSLGNS